MRVSGDAGELRVGYQRAADFARWELGAEAPAFRCRARMRSVHPLWIRESPLDLVLTVGPTTWVWHNVTAVITGEAVEIALTHRPEVVITTAAHA